MESSVVVVGVDGSRSAQTAASWAAQEASRRHAILVIAHGGDGVDDLDPDSGVSSGAASSYGRALVTDTESMILEGSSSCALSTVVTAESATELLVRLSCDAELLVLGTHAQSGVLRQRLGNVAFQVAGHARCPVVVVPADWPESDRGVRRPVVVGVSRTEQSDTGLELAFAEAAARGAELHVVFSWYRPEWESAPPEDLYVAGEQFRAAQEAWLEQLLTAGRLLHPQVQVITRCSGDPVLATVLGAARDADLLVLGARFADGHFFSRLGPITARLLREARCPVMVAGHSKPSGPRRNSSRRFRAAQPAKR